MTDVAGTVCKIVRELCVGVTIVDFISGLVGENTTVTVVRSAAS